MPDTHHTITVPDAMPADNLPRPRRIAAMIATTDVSGPGRQLVALAGELIATGIEVVILLLARPGTALSFAEFARAHGIDCRVIVDRGPLDPATLTQVRAFIREWRPDVMQTHAYKQTAIMYLLRRMGLACPWVAVFEGQTDKGAKDRLYTRLEFAMLPAADRLVVMSQLQRAMFPRRPGRVRVVHNSVPQMAPSRPATELPPVLRRTRGAGSVPLIGAIGRLSREKGVDVFLESLARLAARGVTATAVLVGDGAEQARLAAQAEALGLAKDVVFAGRIEAMADVYAALDLMVIPSRSEGLPSVLLEAMQQDLPVVSTRVGAMIEIASAHPDAFVMVPPENPDALADGIADALAGRAAPERATARAAVVEAFSSARRGRQMLQIYGEALALRGRR